MGLSSNSVIHFTSNISNLKGILSNGFDIRYCRETFDSKTRHLDLIVPMVSFCDIPFSQIKDHVKSYGSYGIGLSKKWAESKGLNPVLYLEKNSMLTENILTKLYDKIKGDKTKVIDLDETERQIFDVLRYIKNYQGDLRRKDRKTIPDYRFSDETEWRYVLDTSIEHLLFGKIQPTWDNKKIQEIKASQNKEIEENKLLFSPEDISYIIIKNENQRDGVIQTIEKVNGKHAHHAVRRLTSRIISTEQLITDF